MKIEASYIRIPTAFALLTLSSVTQSQEKMYWVDSESGLDHIQRANLDDSSPEVVLTGMATPLWQIILD